MTQKNSKEDPIPLSWAEDPQIDVESYWVNDGRGNIYPQKFVNINGALFTVETADDVRHELGEALEELR